MAIDSIRKVAFDVDCFELDHYNDEKPGVWEEAQDEITKAEEYTSSLYEKKSEFLNGKDIYNDLEPHFANLRCEIDQLEHIGLQSSLIRSKHLHNLLQAARERDGNTYHNPKIDHVTVTLPWYKVNNLIEKLYIKYHKTEIHKYYDLVEKYIHYGSVKKYNDEKYCYGGYSHWKEIREEYRDMMDDEETISNHYHTHDKEWQYGVDPKECKNLPDFFKKRIRRIKRNRRRKEIAEVKRENKQKIVQAKEHKLRNYVSLHQYLRRIPGSVYWFVDKNKKFAKNKKLPFGVLYVGESKNFQNRFVAYAPKSSDRLTELERKMKKKFPNLKEEDIKQFIRDPKQCCLKEVKYNFLSNDYRRRYFEQRLIQTTRPLLNTTKVIHYGDKT
mgnify:FL=1|tara:strand:- start:67 stop:1221 length:1155 start_codon:yes stop_codon:yes gene_type:complete